MQQGLSELKSFIFQDCFHGTMSHEPLHKFVDSFSNQCNEISWSIDKACVESVGQFGKYPTQQY